MGQKSKVKFHAKAQRKLKEGKIENVKCFQLAKARNVSAFYNFNFTTPRASALPLRLCVEPISYVIWL